MGGEGGGDPAPVCGDGVREGHEACDDGEDNSDTRPDACREDCTLPRCGDGVLDTGEACLLGSTTPCQEVSPHLLGAATCDGTCAWDLSLCRDPVCGDGVVEGEEACDGAQLGGATCRSLGFGKGALACTSGCTFDTSACDPCGNGVREEGEDCDLFDLGGESCLSLGYAGGALSCTSACNFDLGSCSDTLCGNGMIDPGEDCDGSLLGGVTCRDRGYAGGALSCTSECAFDEANCTQEVPAICGDGILQAGETCDDGDLIPGDGCDGACQLEADGLVCGEMISLNEEATFQGADFTYTGNNRGKRDNATPSCHVYQKDDLALALWVGERSELTLEVEQDPAAQFKANHVLHVRTDCSDAASELGCAAQMAGGAAPKTTLVLDEVGPNTQLYIYVDTDVGQTMPMTSGGGFILTGTSVPIRALGEACDATVRCEAGSTCSGGVCQ
jgi:cysteine-rich repeat protein